MISPMAVVRTQVGIIGAGPAGLLLARLLQLEGIDTVVVEQRSREYVTERVRAGVLEQGTTELLVEAGVGGRMQREGLRHTGIHLAFSGQRHHIDFQGLTGRSITVYGQNEVVKDLIDAHLATGRPLHFEAEDVAIASVDGARPLVRCRVADREFEIQCDFLAGCDGFHGICRPSIPPDQRHAYERDYPFAWLGILAHAAPSCDELVYSLHDRGFALFSMRSPAVTRLYLQCKVDESPESWTDDRIWEELEVRFQCLDGWRPNRGEIFQKGITPMRSFVAEPMRYGNLFLAGDAAHIVPPTGAKGLNLAVSDVRTLSRALSAYYRDGGKEMLDAYSEHCLRRVWKAQRFSWWMTSLFHRSPESSEFDYRRQLAELDYLVSSRAAMTSLAENYVGLPFE